MERKRRFTEEPSRKERRLSDDENRRRYKENRDDRSWKRSRLRESKSHHDEKSQRKSRNKDPDPMTWGVTEFSLNDRFSVLSSDRPVVVEDNIFIEIERRVHGKEPFKIPKHLNPKCVSFPKKQLENKSPLSSRQEFGTTEKESDKKYVHDRRRRREIEEEEETDRRRRRRRGEEEDKRGVRRTSLRDLMSQGKTTIQIRPAPDEEKELPDFAKRPDKYSYENWKSNPEIIPKGRKYYEHDDRGDGSRSDLNNQNRFPWSRDYRRNRGWVRNERREENFEWKHDKFYEIDQEVKEEEDEEK